MLDAHNCYPYEGRWADRIERALAQPLPLAIEQDLRWYEDPAGGEGRALVAHDPPLSGHEPTLEAYFFERIRPLMEKELADPGPAWPVITLNLDFKTEEDAHLEAVWALLGKYEAWLTTAAKVPGESPLKLGPLLVLTGDSDKQARFFHDRLPDGARLRLFGAVHSARPQDPVEAASMTPEQWVSERGSSYRRWSNNPWMIVEEGGQNKAGDWTPEEAARLKALADYAHARGLWLRLYTLNGHDPADQSGGWSKGYNFGSLEAAQLRWRAAVEAGVDFLATDQYEDFQQVLDATRKP
ncbi:MAG: hypothetical protein GC160_04585 [Acidobacteria bacterium]|nr:hypothetical protein [Acidobacteriota bacterium]